MKRPTHGADAVLSARIANAVHGRSAVRHALARKRWQRPYLGVVVTHNGDLTIDERRLAVATWAGPRAALSHATAADMAGLQGFSTPMIHITVPVGVHPRRASGVCVHTSRVLDRDVHPASVPRRTRMERSLLDLASTAATADIARSVLAAGVQQRLTTAARVRALLALFPSLPRRALIATALDDIEGGSHSLPEIEFVAAIRAAGLPEPDRQAMWVRQDGRAFLDARWDSARLTVEIDGIGHLDPRAWIYDLDRQNELVASGERVLRFASFMVRDGPTRVTDRIAQLLGR
jgi:hypothetical protein